MQTVFIAVWLDFIVCFNGLIFCSVLVSDDEIKKINLYSNAHSQQMSKLDLLSEAKTMFTWSQRNCVQESSRGNHSTHRPIPLPAGRGNAKKADFKEGVSIFRHQNGFHQLMGCNTSRVESGRAEGHNEGETTWMSASSKLFPFHVLE